MQFEHVLVKCLLECVRFVSYLIREHGSAFEVGWHFLNDVGMTYGYILF